MQENYDSKVNELEILQEDYDSKVNELKTAQKEISDLQTKLDNEHTALAKLQKELVASSESEEQLDDNQKESLKLFEDVYIPYANREKPFIFEAVKTFANSCDYDTEITNATSDSNASIKFFSPNGDYVYFVFSPINNIDTIMIVSFYQASSNSEVSLGNYSSDGSASYDTYTTHVIGEQSKNVKGTDEQRRFLFKNNP